MKLYGRTSIDNSRRVRELCHTVQLELMKSARKRMEKRIPKIVGPWLAGTYDKDRVVSRAATEGLSSFLNTDEKVTQFWRRLQAQILDYALESVRETPDTLSDERSTTKEDSEAKYYRVVGASLALVLNLLQKVGVDQTGEQLDQYLGAESVWALAAADDSHVRRMVYQLALICLQKHNGLLRSHLPRLGRALVSDALKIKQTGSALDYVRVLTTLTEKHREVWGTKKHPFSRLQPFVENGSQGSSSAFWQELRQLIASLSRDAISSDVATGFLKALRAGISSREEPRANAPYAWACYFETFLLFLDKLTPEQCRLDFIKDTFHPVTEQYLHPVADKSVWATAAPLSLLPKAWATLASTTSDEQRRSVCGEWTRLGVEFRTRMNTSLPEVSKDFQSSQQSVADEGDRWFALVGAIDSYIAATYGSEQAAKRMREPFAEASGSILQEAVELLIRRNFKPFGAASVVESALKRFPAVLPDDGSFLVDNLYRSEHPDRVKIMLSSSSAPYILSSLNILGSMPDHAARYGDIWTQLVNILLESNEQYVPGRIAMLISTEKGKLLAQKHQPLQDYLVSTSLQTAKGGGATWELLDAALVHEALTESGVRHLATEILQVIGTSAGPTSAESTSTALKAVELILRHRPAMFADASDLHVQLVTILLALTEVSDKTASARLTAIRALLDKHTDGVASLVGIVQKNLDSLDGVTGSAELEYVFSPSSSPVHFRLTRSRVDTLVEQAKSILDAHTVPPEQLFPSTNVWMDQLSIALKDAPSQSAPLALTSNLGGAYALVQMRNSLEAYSLNRDRQGRSIPARMALFTAKLLDSGFDLSSLPQKLQTELLYMLCLVIGLSEDELLTEVRPGVADSRLWCHRALRGSYVGSVYKMDIVDDTKSAEVEEFIALARRIVTDIVSSADNLADGEILDGSLVGDLISLMLEQARGLGSLALYSARALGLVLETLVEAHGLPSSAEDTLTRLEILKAQPETAFSALAFITGFGEPLASSKAVKVFCNRLISDVAGATLTGANTLLTMVLLNACLAVYESGELPVDNRRQVFAVRQMASWLEEAASEGRNSSVATEACKALNRLLPNVASVYGPYWEQAVSFCISLWSGVGCPELHDLCTEPCLHASLKLSATLESMEGANDDLDDALAAHAGEKSLALLHLLKYRVDRPSESSDIVDALLCRQVAKIPLHHIKDLSDLYALVASESREVQTAAFGILGKAIAAAQAQISVDVLLEKQGKKTLGLVGESMTGCIDMFTDAKLPDELMSLLLDAPVHDAYQDDELARFPPSVRSYLLSWHLVFDAFRTAASKVRNDYAEQLKTSASLEPLMNFMFDVLGHSAARPLNLDRAGFTTEHIRAYDIKIADSEPDERNMHWLLIHLFYLSMKYLPGLFKVWFLDCRSKQTKVAVESWMTKYFSPAIISENLDEIVDWAAKQEPPEDDEKELMVKVSRTAKEVTAGYEVDELHASIAIRIPPSYPLESVNVVGINRVAVSEKKWQNWLMITQGVITLGVSRRFHRFAVQTPPTHTHAHRC